MRNYFTTGRHRIPGVSPRDLGVCTWATLPIKARQGDKITVVDTLNAVSGKYPAFFRPDNDGTNPWWFVSDGNSLAYTWQGNGPYSPGLSAWYLGSAIGPAQPFSAPAAGVWEAACKAGGMNIDAGGRDVGVGVSDSNTVDPETAGIAARWSHQVVAANGGLTNPGLSSGPASFTLAINGALYLWIKGYNNVYLPHASLGIRPIKVAGNI